MFIVFGFMLSCTLLTAIFVVHSICSLLFSRSSLCFPIRCLYFWPICCTCFFDFSLSCSWWSYGFFSSFLHVLFFVVVLLTRYIALFVENHMFRTVPFPCHCYISQGNTFKMIQGVVFMFVFAVVFADGCIFNHLLIYVL